MSTVILNEQRLDLDFKYANYVTEFSIVEYTFPIENISFISGVTKKIKKIDFSIVSIELTTLLNFNEMKTGVQCFYIEVYLKNRDYPITIEYYNLDTANEEHIMLQNALSKKEKNLNQSL